MQVVLHNIRSVYNVGSIFRTADAAGIKKIHLCGITPSPLDKFGSVRTDFTKVSLKAEQYVLWKSHSSTMRVLKNLRKEGFFILAIEQAKTSIPYYSLKINKIPREKIILVLGDETRGLPQSILKLSDLTLEIPMLGKKESLNVSVAFGIVAFHLRFSSRNKNE